MGHRNHNLSYIAGANVRMGRAVKLQSDGTVVEITDKNDLVMGWAMSSVLLGYQVHYQKQNQLWLW